MNAKVLEQVRVTAGLAPELAVVVGWQPGVGIEVELDGGVVAVARSILALSPQHLDAAVSQRSEVLVTFVGNDPSKPMIIGFVAEVPPATTDADADPSATVSAVEAMPDGIKVRAKEEIQFRCGKASLTLRKDGAVVIRGDKVISRAAKNNRITGGSVQIN